MKLPTQKSKIVKDLSRYIFQIYGEPKVGKSTFASQFPDAMFICTEPGHKFLEIYGGDHVHETWDDIKETTKLLRSQKHQFKTIVVDTVDNAWDMCRAHVNKRLGISHESEDKGYGRSWDMVTNEFKSVFRYLSNFGFGVVFISHAEIGTKADKGIERSYMDNTLQKRPRKFINGLCDFILYFYIDNSRNHLILTKGNLNVNAGDRTGLLPERMKMDFEEMKKCLGVEK